MYSVGVVFKTGDEKAEEKGRREGRREGLKKAVGRGGREKGLDISYILYFLHYFRIMVLV